MIPEPDAEAGTAGHDAPGRPRLRGPFGPWEPAPPAEVADRFGAVADRWWVAGGFAIELAVGHRFRRHGDIDVLLLREDQLDVQRALPGWQWWAADPPGTLRPWAFGEILPPDVHDIWCRPGPNAPWRIQAMLDESDGPDWISRRNAAVRRPVRTLGRTSPDGVPYLAPDVQLFYKAKSRRPKDEADFDAALPVLTAAQRHWLADAIARTHGPHPWTPRLADPAAD